MIGNNIRTKSSKLLTHCTEILRAHTTELKLTSNALIEMYKDQCLI